MQMIKVKVYFDFKAVQYIVIAQELLCFAMAKNASLVISVIIVVTALMGPVGLVVMAIQH